MRDFLKFKESHTRFFKLLVHFLYVVALNLSKWLSDDINRAKRRTSLLWNARERLLSLRRTLGFIYRSSPARIIEREWFISYIKHFFLFSTSLNSQANFMQADFTNIKKYLCLANKMNVKLLINKWKKSSLLL